jgi:hypothetical protein
MPPLDWRDDEELGLDFLQLTLAFTPDYDGEVTASLVRNRSLLSPTKAAILYLHGFIDYFFQRHGAERFFNSPFLEIPHSGAGVLAWHDLTLSLKKPRELCLEAMVEWAGTT